MTGIAAALNTRFNRRLAALVALYGAGVACADAVFGRRCWRAAGFISQRWASPRRFSSLGRCYTALYMSWHGSIRHGLLRRWALICALSFSTGQRWMTGVPAAILVTLFLSFYTSAKTLIPLIHPYAWDPALARLSAALNFGSLPWTDDPYVTSALSFLYRTWFFTKVTACLYMAFTLRRPRLREQFFLTYAVVWIVGGTILATLLSSAGPCYYGLLYPGLPDPYARLMEYLHRSSHVAPVYDLAAMEYLWNAYRHGETTLFSGISAMPSMHVAMMCLLMLTCWRYNRLAGTLATVYLLLIMIGSVQLGWHYAVDGYVAVIITTAVWWLVGRWTGRDDEMEEKETT